MQYPTLTELATSREMVDSFAGYNHNLRIGSGELFDMENMTSDYYPVLSPRGRRGVYTSPASPKGMIAKDSLCYVDGTDFVINEYRVDMGLNDEPKQLVSMGAYVIIMPDKKYINTLDLTDFGNIEASVTTTTDVTFQLCTIEGAGYDGVVVSAAEPENPENMAYWIDTSSTPHTLKQFSSASGMWISIATTYVKISATGIGAAFSPYDGVSISGILDDKLQDMNGNMVVWACGDDYIVVVGMLDTTASQAAADGAITVARKMPNLDYVTESENRLWGCRYGTALNGDVVNEIYACKLGDFKNWNCFMGLSTDSYVASCGTDGQFTGAITHMGYPLFFKENCVHKVYGNYPKNYQIQSTACRGVQRGCSRSLAIVNETLYYKARSGVCAYDGSLPVEISSQLGDVVYSDAVAGAFGNKYYISMKSADGVYHLFAYDTAKGMWHKEDNTQAESFCCCREDLYYIDHADRQIKTVCGTGTPDTGKVEWMAETGVMGVSSPDKKYISRLTVRLSMDAGTRVQFFIQYDSMGMWEHLYTMECSALRSFAVPLRPRRCDHMRLRICGVGDAKIYSIAKTVEEGSDV